MAFGSNEAKSTNLPEIILSLIRGVTGGSDMVPGCGIWPTVEVVTDVGGVALAAVSFCCC